MPVSIEPVVRTMVLCERVLIDPENPQRIDLHGFVSVVVVAADALFPVVVPQLSVFLLLTSGRGTGRGQIVVVNDETSTPCFGTRAIDINLGNDPLRVIGQTFHILNCPFPSPGLYSVEFRYNGRMLASQNLDVRRRPS